MKLRLRNKQTKKGQSTIEFALASLFILGFIFFFMQLCFVFAFGNYVHYATFMSARTLLSGNVSEQKQKDEARIILTNMLKQGEGAPGQDRWKILGKGIGGDGDSIIGAHIGTFTGQVGDLQYNEQDRGKSWLEGVRYTFRSRLFLLPMGSAASTALDDPAEVGVRDLELTSESWLQRDPSVEECDGFMNSAGGRSDLDL